MYAVVVACCYLFKQILQKLGFGPKLYASFSNGLAYQFFPGKTLNRN